MDEMKKYIIEFSEDPHTIRLLKLKNGDKFPVTEFKAVTPYTEPDFDAVRKEAYEQGRKDGKIEGQAEAWVCVKKIAFNPESVECVDDIVRMGFDVGDGNGWSEAIEELFEKYTASEAIEKIRQYEQEQEAFHVGDEFVNGRGDKFVITKMDGEEIDRYIDEYGRTYAMNVKYIEMRKTGRHFPEIATVLQKMRENNDNK